MKHASAVKRHRQSERRHLRNQAIRSRLRSAVKQVRAAVAVPDVGTANTKLRTAERLLAKAVTKGVLHPNTASRHISRLTRAVNALRSS